MHTYTHISPSKYTIFLAINEIFFFLITSVCPREIFGHYSFSSNFEKVFPLKTSPNITYNLTKT